MQRGPLLQPLAQQNAFCQGRLALASSQSSAPAGSRPHTASASKASTCLTCPDTQKEANPPAGRVFLSAFSPKKPHSFLRGKPRFAPLSPRPVASLRGLTPLPQSCHGFVLAPSSLQKPRQPRVLAIKWGWGRFTPEPGSSQSEPGIPAKDCSEPSSSVPAKQPIPCRRYLNAPPAEAGRCAASPFRLPCGARTAWHADRASHFGDTASRYAASHGRTSNPWKNPSRIFQCLEGILPTSGRKALLFSKARKTGTKKFQPSEEILRIFPMLGRARRLFSKVRNALRLCEAKTSRLWNADYVFFQGSENLSSDL